MLNGAKDGNGFENNPQNINRKGRPKKIYTILKEKGFCADDIRTAMGEIAFYNEGELKSVKDDESKPIITRIIANQYFNALKKNDWYRIKEIIEQFAGKPQQSVSVNTPDADPMAMLEAQNKASDILKEIKKYTSKHGD